MNVVRHLLTQAQQRPDALALASGSGKRCFRITFGQLEKQSANVALVFRACGLKAGDRILFLQPVSIGLYVALLAALRTGMVAVFPDPGGGAKLIRYGCRSTKPKAVLGAFSAWPALLLPEVGSLPLRFSLGEGLPGSINVLEAKECAVSTILEDVEDECPALLTFTSGSTGLAKIAARSHGFLEAQKNAVSHCLDLKAGDTDLCTLPIFALANLACGVTSVLADLNWKRIGASAPEPILKQLQEFDPERVAASPALIDRLVHGWEQKPQIYGPFRLKRIFTGGAPVFPELLRRIKSLCPDANPVAVYGSTEAEPIARLFYEEVDEKDNARMLSGKGLLVGTPVPEVDLAIIKDTYGEPMGALSEAEFTALKKGVNESGEVVVSGPHVLGGYLNGIGDEQNKFRVNGRQWHRTGDAGYLDERGCLWLLGRCSQRVELSGRMIYPLAVEAVACSFRWVRHAGFVSLKGEPYLAISVHRQPSSVQFRSFREALAWVRLKGIATLPQLPLDRRHNAKVDYVVLRKLLEREFRRG